MKSYNTFSLWFTYRPFWGYFCNRISSSWKYLNKICFFVFHGGMTVANVKKQQTNKQTKITRIISVRFLDQVDFRLVCSKLYVLQKQKRKYPVNVIMNLCSSDTVLSLYNFFNIPQIYSVK